MIHSISKNDLSYLESIGISKSDIDSQISFLDSHNPIKLKLIRPCVVGDGIISKEEAVNIADLKNESEDEISRFIPASGFGTRMFQLKDSDKSFFNDLKFTPIFELIYDFSAKNNIDLETIIKEKNIDELEDILLSDFKLNLKNTPKALLPFHKINNLSVSPIEEIISYFANDIVNSNLIFAIQEENKDEYFKKLENSKFINDINFEEFVKFTYQDHSTDSLCFDENKNVLRKEDGLVYTHPSGHGALLKNLNEINSDYILINNIDNLSPKTKSLRYEITKMLYKLIRNIKDKNKILGKPIRVCGVIKDQHSKGGKPFWVSDGTDLSLQIVEESQVDFNNSEQKKIWELGTYFNPVEMICSFKDSKGLKYDLSEYSNMSLQMKTKKNILEKEAIFVEKPGLWNGSMHNWHTTFVEISEKSFTPVKNFTDLFLPVHQT